MRYKIFLYTEKLDKNHELAIAEYAKRLSAYCQVKLIKDKKAEKLISRLDPASYRVAIKTEGMELDSPGLSEHLSGLAVSGISDVEITIGIEPETADFELSLSSFDLSANLLTVLLYEQLYRAYTIMTGKTYHK